MATDETYRLPNTAERMAEAARAFLTGLDADQRGVATRVFDDEQQRTDWHYVPRDRIGLPIKDMDETQQQLAHQLVATGLSAGTHDRARQIMTLENTLAEIEGPRGNFARDEELYYISIFGDPGAEGAWFWRFEGHHISLNNTIVDGQLMSSTPVFLGANPAEVRHGQREGLRALTEEEDVARALLSDLDGEQKTQAIIDAEAPADIITKNAPFVRDEFEAAGLAAADMTAGQREILRDLVAVYVGRMPDEVAERQMEKLQSNGDLGTARFAWAGAEERGKGHYYRVRGTTFLAEYDNTQNDANHIHAVWRDLENDFGEDILRRHYRTAH